MRTRTKAKIAKRSAQAMVEHPTLRKAAMTAGPPVVKVRFGIARRRARRRALERAARLQDVARTAGDALATYGPPAATALGLNEPSKPKRGPTIAVGAVLGASVVFFLDPPQGAARRAKLIGLVSGGKSETPPPPPAV